jgi:hypothetical protein
MAWAGHRDITTTQRYFGHFHDHVPSSQVSGLDAMIVDVGNDVTLDWREVAS